MYKVKNSVFDKYVFPDLKYIHILWWENANLDESCGFI
jgi:hypothetical protein